jgi:peptide/nickel transport system substrate-binding protein
MKRPSVAATLVALLILAACAAPAHASSASPAPDVPDASPSASASPLALKVGLAEDVDGMNPFSSWSGITWEAFRLNYDFLTWYDADYNVAPDLATSWEHTPDGKVWTFHIRRGVTWQDGVPLTAHDIAFTYNLILDNDLSAYTSYLPFVTKVEAPDDSTLVITNSKSSAGMLALYIPIVPEHVWSKVPANKLDSWPNVPTIGSGPFQVVESKKGHYVKMVANKSYFGGAPTIDQILFEIYQDPDTCVQDYKAGNLDAISLTGSTQYNSLKTAPGTSGAYEAIGFHEMGFNCWQSPKSKGNPALLDADLRRAIHWAIDEDKIVDVSMSGYAQSGTSVISPLSPYHWQPAGDQLVSYDPAKAKEILDAAGYKDVNGDGMREDTHGKPMVLRLTALTDYPEDVSAAKMIHQWLSDVGVATKLDLMTEAAFYDANWAGDFDIYFWSWGGDIDPGFMLSCFTTQQIHSWSDCYLSDAAFDALYTQQAQAFDPAQRKQLVQQAQQYLYDQAPYVVLFYYVDTQAFRSDRWTGWTYAPPGKGGVIRNFMRTTYLDLKPVSGTAAKSSHAGLIAALVVAVIAAAVVIAVVARRRRPRHVEEQEAA